MLNTVNQLFFATTLNCNFPELNWFAVTNFRNQNACRLSEKKLPEKFENWFTARKFFQRIGSCKPHNKFFIHK